MKKILKQIGIKSVLKKNEMKIYGKGKVNASNKKIYLGNIQGHVCFHFRGAYKRENNYKEFWNC